MQLSPSSSADRLGANGEMARCINSFDGTKHPLGPGGTIEVESDLSKGTNFKLYLPLQRESAPSLENSVSA